jgi:hypothetical protein
MADQTYNIIKAGQGQTITNLKKHVTLEVTSISDTDTITVDELDTVNVAVVIDLSDGTEYTVTLSTNVITIDDQACSSDHVIVLVVGV